MELKITPLVQRSMRFDVSSRFDVNPAEEQIEGEISTIALEKRCDCAEPFSVSAHRRPRKGEDKVRNIDDREVGRVLDESAGVHTNGSAGNRVGHVAADGYEPSWLR